MSLITDYYSSGPRKLNERIALAKHMAHSVEEQLQYMKISNIKPLSESKLNCSSSYILLSLSSSLSSFSIISSSNPSFIPFSSNNEEQKLTLHSPKQSLITDYYKAVIPTDSSVNTGKSKNLKQINITNFFNTS